MFTLIVGNVGAFNFECEHEARKDFNDCIQSLNKGKTSVRSHWN